jgi:hypothetical protein
MAIQTPQVEVPIFMMEEQKSKFPTEVVSLPSRGLLYPKEHPLAKGIVEMKYMTAKEEDILATQSYIAQGIVLDKVCESMLVTKVNFEDFLLGDKNALILAARMYGYGPEYGSTVQSEDGRKIPVIINLAEVPHKDFDESLIIPGENRFKYVLPFSKTEIEFKLLTVGDQRIIDKDLKAMQRNDVGSTRNLTTRLKHMILSVNGQSDKSIVNKFVNEMHVKDSRSFREYIQKIQPDIDLSLEVEDPITGEFFRVDFEIG